MKDESEVSQLVQIAAVHDSCYLMRNNSGACADATGRVIRYGLGNISKRHQENIKSLDLIGFTKTVITQEMVGTTVAIFTAVEVKKEDWNPDKKLDPHEIAQNAFIQWVKVNGGIAGFVNGVDRLKLLFRK